MAKKKYKPNKEIAKITSSLVGVNLGSSIAYTTIDKIPSKHTININSTTKLMNTIPLMQTGGSVIGAINMLGDPPKYKKHKR